MLKSGSWYSVRPWHQVGFSFVCIIDVLAGNDIASSGIRKLLDNLGPKPGAESKIDAKMGALKTKVKGFADVASKLPLTVPVGATNVCLRMDFNMGPNGIGINPDMVGCDSLNPD